jgi:putative oxidoreductase
MKALGLSPLARLSGLVPPIVRLIVGVIMAVHGWQKLTGGPANFAAGLEQLGVPAPGLMAWVVTFTELGGGLLLILGLLTRLAALALTVNLSVAILLVKLDVGLIAPMGGGAGMELDLALIAGFVTLLLLGAGRLSLDWALGIDRDEPGRADRRGGLSAQRH